MTVRVRPSRIAGVAFLVVSLAALVLALGLVVSAAVEAQTAPDSDGDGITDDIETRYGSDPQSSRSRPEHLEYDQTTGANTCNDTADNDLDGPIDAADPGCAVPPTATAPPTVPPTIIATTTTTTPTATTPPRVTPTATTPPIQQPTTTPTQPPIAAPTVTPGPDPTAPGPGGEVAAPEQPTEQPGFGVPDPPDLRITDVEVTQGIQDLDNRMPLVERRLTYLRAYVATDDGQLSGVDAAMAAFRNGQQLGLSEDDDDPAVLFADNGTITAREDGGERVNLDDSLYFKLPRYWAEDTTTFRVLVYGQGNPDSVDFEPNPDNNEVQVAMSFEEGLDANLMLVPVHLHQNSNANQASITYTWFANQTQATRVVNDIFRLNPVPRLYVYGGNSDNAVGPLCHSGWCDPFPWLNFLPREWDLSNPAQVGLPTVRIASMKDNTDPWKDNLAWYGMAPNSVTMTMQSEGFDPINISGYAKNGVSYGKMDDGFSDDSPWHISRAATLAHELAHNLGLKHVNCNGNEEAGGAVDDGYPYQNPDCSLADVDEDGYYGLDVYWHVWPWLSEPAVISNDPDEADPANGFPLLGYLSPKWADPYDYCLMLNGYDVDCDLDDLQIAVPDRLRDAFVTTVEAMRSGVVVPQTDGAGTSHEHGPSQPSALQAAQSFALIYGLVNRDSGEAAIIHVQRLDDPLPHVLEEAQAREAARSGVATSTYQLALEDGGGRVLIELPLVDVDVAHHSGVDAIQMFRELVPWPAGVEAVTVRSDGDAIAERPVSASAPTVQITSPSDGAELRGPLTLTWDATDGDGDALVAMVQYSADDGATWRVLIDAVGGGEVTIESLGYLPASDRNGRLRVTVNDGANTGSDEVSGLTVPNSAPAPRILGPGHGQRAFQGDIVSFEGSATDWEDGDLPGGALTWNSSLDGEIGGGEVLDTVDLSPGEHKITLRAEDSDGAVGETEIVVTIVGRLLPDRSEELRRAADQLDADVGGLSDDDDTRNVAIAAAAGAGGMLILFGLGWGLRRVTRRRVA